MKIENNTGQVTAIIGNSNSVNQSVSKNDFAALRKALETIRGEAAHPTVSTEERATIIDHVEAVEAELNKPAPEPGRVMRFSKYLADKTTTAAFAIGAQMLMKALAGG